VIVPRPCITRGKRLLVLIGQRKALGIAVRNDRPQMRHSGLLASLQFQGDHQFDRPQQKGLSAIRTGGSES